MIVFIDTQWGGRLFVFFFFANAFILILQSFRICFFWAVFMNIGDSCWGMCFLSAHSTPISVSGSHRYAWHEGLAAHFASIP